MTVLTFLLSQIRTTLFIVSAVIRVTGLVWLVYLTSYVKNHEIKIVSYVPQQIPLETAVTLKPNILDLINWILLIVDRFAFIVNCVPRGVLWIGVIGVAWSLVTDYHRWKHLDYKPGLGVRSGLAIAHTAAFSAVYHMFYRLFGHTTYNDVLLSLKIVKVVSVRSLLEKQNLVVNEYVRNLGVKLEKGELSVKDYNFLLETKTAVLERLIQDDWLITHTPVQLSELAAETANLHAAAFAVPPPPVADLPAAVELVSTAATSWEWAAAIGICLSGLPSWCWTHKGDITVAVAGTTAAVLVYQYFDLGWYIRRYFNGGMDDFMQSNVEKLNHTSESLVETINSVTALHQQIEKLTLQNAQRQQEIAGIVHSVAELRMQSVSAVTEINRDIKILDEIINAIADQHS